MAIVRPLVVCSWRDLEDSTEDSTEGVFAASPSHLTHATMLCSVGFALQAYPRNAPGKNRTCARSVGRVSGTRRGSASAQGARQDRRRHFPVYAPAVASVDDYLAVLTPAQCEQFERIRRIVRSMVPDAEETISYGIPTFKHRGKFLIYFAAFKDHLSVYPTVGARAAPEGAASLCGRNLAQRKINPPRERRVRIRLAPMSRASMSVEDAPIAAALQSKPSSTPLPVETLDDPNGVFDPTNTSTWPTGWPAFACVAAAAARSMTSRGWPEVLGVAGAVCERACASASFEIDVGRSPRRLRARSHPDSSSAGPAATAVDASASTPAARATFVRSVS